MTSTDPIGDSALIQRMTAAERLKFESQIQNFEIYLSSILPAPSQRSQTIDLIEIRNTLPGDLYSRLEHLGQTKGHNWAHVSVSATTPREHFIWSLPVRQTRNLESCDWLLIATHSQIIEYFLTTSWRANELVVAIRQLAEAQVSSPAVLARSLLEMSASTWFATCGLRDNWEVVKHQRSMNTKQNINAIQTLRIESNRLMFSTRFSDSAGDWATISRNLKSDNAAQLVEMIAKNSNPIILQIYEKLCNCVHPSFFSRQPFMGPPERHSSGTHDRRQISSLGIPIDPENYSDIPDIIARAVVKALIILQTSLDILVQLADDVVLTADLKSLSIFDTWRLLQRPGQNDRCPCRSGFRFRECIHEWKFVFPPMPSLEIVVGDS